MRFSSGVANQKDSAAIRCTDARQDGACGPPAAGFELRSIKGIAYGGRTRHDVSQNGVPGRSTGMIATATFKAIASDAARQADALVIRLHQTPVTAGEREQRHEPRLQPACAEARFEAEEIGMGRYRPRGLSRQRASVPRAVRSNHDRRAKTDDGSRGAARTRPLAVVRRCDDACEVTERALHLYNIGRLPHVCARGGRTIEQQCVEVLPPERVTPAVGVTRKTRHCCRNGVAACEHPHTPHSRTCETQKIAGNPELAQQREIRRGKKFTAHFTTRKSGSLDERHRPARTREQEGRCRTGRAATDDDRVMHGWPRTYV